LHCSASRHQLHDASAPRAVIGSRNSKLESRVPIAEFLAPRFGITFRVLDDGIRTSRFEFRLSASGLRLLGAKFRFSRFEFRSHPSAPDTRLNRRKPASPKQ
jgi:hypothetical protein